MRVNVYAEEMTEQLEIVSKDADGHTFTGLRFYLHMPVSQFKYSQDIQVPINVDAETHRTSVRQVKGPFIHRPGDDDSSAVTFWGKEDLRGMLRKALALLDNHYAKYEFDVEAKKLYTDHINRQTGIHSNRYPSWEELPNLTRDLWRQKAIDNTGRNR